MLETNINYQCGISRNDRYLDTLIRGIGFEPWNRKNPHSMIPIPFKNLYQAKLD